MYWIYGEGMSDLEKIAGCLYGQALGDAMGMPSELWSKAKVMEFFGWIDDFLDGPKENIAASTFKRGQFTDDTAQAVALMDAIFEKEGQIDGKTIALHILKWAKKVRAFEENILGPTSKASLLAISQNTPIEEIESNGVTNGAAMRIAPIGCLMPTSNRMEFINAVREACSPTHKSDMAIAGASVIAWAIARAIEGIGWPKIKEEVVDIAIYTQSLYASTFSPSLAYRIEHALKVVEQKSSLEEMLTAIYEKVGAGMDIIESVPAALAMVEIAQTQPKKCAILSANLGGDTDTIGAMATAICGAIHGISAIEDADIKLINEANNVNLFSYAEKLHGYKQNRETL